MADLMSMFEDLERQSEPKSKDVILRAPFGYPGGKSRSVKHILPHLPYRRVYVEAFGGTGAILLSRKPSDLEVLNDRYMGIVAFYRCLQHPKKMQLLCDRLEVTVHSREDFVWCKETWEDCEDDVERAARWLCMIKYSFSQKGNNWGRATSYRGVLSGKIQNAIKHFPEIHQRLIRTQIENQDWYDCLIDYDSYETVFYLDPPYIDAYAGTYKHEMTKEDHVRLIETIFSLKGFVALSGFSNPVYEERPWDDRYEWEVFQSMRGEVFNEGNKKAHLRQTDDGRRTQKEVLWIKE